jgi:hypothetical protein
MRTNRKQQPGAQQDTRQYPGREKLAARECRRSHLGAVGTNTHSTAGNCSAGGEKYSWAGVSTTRLLGNGSGRANCIARMDTVFRKT